MSVVLAAACLSLTVPWAGAEVFSSTARLHALFEEADQVAAILGHYVRMEEARLRAISSLISEVQSMRNRTAGNGVKFVEHPLGAFHFIKKYAQIHTRMEAGTLHKDAVHDKLSGLSLAIPNNDDYEGSASAILRLQRIYNLPKKELMEGRVGGLVVEPLTLEDCNVIARKAHELSYFSQATEWYDVALRETDPSPYVTGEQRRRATLGLIDLYLQHNDLEHANSFANWGKTAYPDCEEIADAYTKVKQAESVAESEDGELPPPAEEQPSDEQYAALCRGEVDWTNEYLSRGYCKLLTDSVPYRLVRQEVLSVDPFIALFHDVLSETEGAFFRQKAQENMQRAKVGNPGSQIVSETRVGQLTWLDDGTPAIKKISDRIMRITGLDVTMRQKFSSSESFQIVNYGIGGHYAPHLDVYENKTVLSDDGDLPSFLKGSGDRLATFLFYLDDVIEGGATVFPRVGVRVPVIKNGAAFWYNLHRTGENDIRTLHAGCPVLLGQKWVANKWIRERGQAFRHGCGLTPDTLHVET